jgi:hypothetical protein
VTLVQTMVDEDRIIYEFVPARADGVYEPMT